VSVPFEISLALGAVSVPFEISLALGAVSVPFEISLAPVYRGRGWGEGVVARAGGLDSGGR
jgi:hypothetical protein